MLKNILNLEGAQNLTKNEQKSINGGKRERICTGSEDINPTNSSACSGSMPVFVANYYGQGLGACCSW